MPSMKSIGVIVVVEDVSKTGGGNYGQRTHITKQADRQF